MGGGDVNVASGSSGKAQSGNVNILSCDFVSSGSIAVVSGVASDGDSGVLTIEWVHGTNV
jgi:hypothetical protein